MAVFSHAQRSRPHRWRLRSYVLDRRDFHEIRMRLPVQCGAMGKPSPRGMWDSSPQAMVGDEEDLPLAVL